MTETQPHPLEVKARPFIEVSDSQIKLFQTCPRSWAYQKLLKIQPEEDRWNLYFGSAVHKGLETLHLGATLQDALQDAEKVCAKDAPDDEEMRLKAKAMVHGYAHHFYPIFNQNWETTACEKWFEYFPDPLVKVRGSRDNESRARIDPAHTALLDFKTTAFKDGGQLGTSIRRNRQLALYGISKYRATNEWPREQGLIFLQKPREKNINSWVQRAQQDPSLYSMASEPFTPGIAWFALAVEQEIVANARQMYALARAFDIHGASALDMAVPNFSNCEVYNRLCGFAEGCHSCRPVHHVMLGR